MNFLPFDFIASHLVKEPFNVPFSDLGKLNPISVRLIYFRDPQWDDLYTPNPPAPPSMRELEAFERKMKKMGYSTEHIDRLWEHLQKRRELLSSSSS